jgi:hypothetical protein
VTGSCEYGNKPRAPKKRGISIAESTISFTRRILIHEVSLSDKQPVKCFVHVLVTLVS